MSTQGPALYKARQVCVCAYKMHAVFHSTTFKRGSLRWVTLDSDALRAQHRQGLREDK